jgi:hypothetical protein
MQFDPATLLSPEPLKSGFDVYLCKKAKTCLENCVHKRLHTLTISCEMYRSKRGCTKCKKVERTSKKDFLWKK